MADLQANLAAGRKPGVRYWIAAILAVIWNAIGCMDYTMTAIRDPGYLSAFPAEMIVWLDTAPVWSMASWALGVWGGLAGSLLLLLRSRWAVAAFAISLFGVIVTAAWQFTSSPPPSMTTPASLAMTIAVWGIAIALLVWSLRLRARGVLR